MSPCAAYVRSCWVSFIEILFNFEFPVRINLTLYMINVCVVFHILKANTYFDNNISLCKTPKMHLEGEFIDTIVGYSLQLPSTEQLLIS